jgi:hypothetical protein
VHWAPGIPRALLLLGERILANLGRSARRGKRNHVGNKKLAVIARLDRAIQYAVASMVDERKPGVLDAPLELVIGLAEGETRWRSMTTV